MKQPREKRLEIIKAALSSKLSLGKARQLLCCSRRSLERYRKNFLEKGEEGLKDHRHSNYRKISREQKERLIFLKRKDRWRSARNWRDELKLPLSEQQVQRILIKAGLNKENLKSN